MKHSFLKTFLVLRIILFSLAKFVKELKVSGKVSWQSTKWAKLMASLRSFCLQYKSTGQISFSVFIFFSSSKYMFMEGLLLISRRWVFKFLSTIISKPKIYNIICLSFDGLVSKLASRIGVNRSMEFWQHLKIDLLTAFESIPSCSKDLKRLVSVRFVPLFISKICS